MTAADPLDPIRRAMRRDGAAMDDLWRMHRHWLASVLATHGPKQCDIADLLQETACSFVRGISGLKEPAAFTAWLRTIAMNVAVSAGRRTKLEQRVRCHATPLNELAAPAQADEKELMTAIEALPVEYREPLLLRAVHHLSQKQIADALGLPETTIETRLVRARKQLRMVLEQTCPTSRGERPWK